MKKRKLSSFDPYIHKDPILSRINLPVILSALTVWYLVKISELFL